eukprot:scaffold308606_cov21-Prasinocladus_malaysianus.AAC.2
MESYRDQLDLALEREDALKQVPPPQHTTTLHTEQRDARAIYIKLMLATLLSVIISRLSYRAFFCQAIFPF